MMLSRRLLVRAVLSLMVTATVAVQPAAVFALSPDDAELGEQWYLETIHALTAWDAQTGSRDVVVAVLDTGVDLDHPDLADNLWQNAGEIADNEIDDDGNGFVDDVHGWDFVDDDGLPEPYADAGDVVASHGTMIAGIVGARGDNETGTAGIAWHVSIMSLRMLDEEGSGDSVIAAQAIRYAVDNGARIINMSFAGVGADTDLRLAVEEAYNAGVVVVAAMGNESEDTDESAVYPACLMGETEDWVIGVASTDRQDDPSDFSNYGRSCTDISAPGEDIFGPMYYDPSGGYYDAYDGDWSGTSVAAPMVTGAAALLLSAYPDLTVDEVRNTLKLSVDPLSLPRALRGKYGSGRLNVAQALAIGAQFSDGSVASSDDDSQTTNMVLQSPAVIAFGNSSNASPTVSLYTADGVQSASFAVYAEAFAGGVRLALGDVNADGSAEVITGTGRGGGPQVRIFTPQGALVGQFFAYDSTSRQGVSVATGDVDNDGTDDIVTAVGLGVSREIIAWSRKGVELARFTATEFSINEELRLAVGDVDGDSGQEIVVAGGFGSTPKIVVYEPDGTRLSTFAPYASGFTGGVYVAVGDVNGDGVDDVVTGTGNGGGPHVRVFNADGAVIGQFFAYGSTERHGVVVAVADTDRDGVSEIIVSPGPGGSEARVMNLSGEILGRWGVTLGGGQGTMVSAW